MGLNRSTIAGLVGELESLGRDRARRARRRPRAAPAGPRRESALTDQGPYVIAVDLGRRPDVGGPGRPGWHRAAARPAPIDGVAEAWQVGSSVATLIREVVEERAGLRAPGRHRDQRPGPGPAQRRPGAAGAQPGVARRLVRLDRARRPGRSTYPISLANDADLGALAEHQRGRRRRRRRPDLRLRQRRRRCRRHHRRAPARGRGRLRRRDRPPALQPERQALPLRQPRLLGDRGRRARHRRGDPLPRGQGPAARRGPRQLHRADQGAARHRRPPRRGAGQHRQRVQPADGRAGRLLPRALHPGRRRGEPRPGRAVPPGPAGVGDALAPRPRRRLGAPRRGRDRLRAALRRPGRRPRHAPWSTSAPGSRADAAGCDVLMPR